MSRAPLRRGPPPGEVLRAPAKLNLSLRVVGRRADGYHEIESLFVPLDLTDELTLRLLPGGEGCSLQVEGGGDAVPGDGRNLAARAAGAFLAAAGLRYAVELRLRKRIPVGAGLGGGSSDAGTVLRALGERFPGALGASELERLALSLGADVPFFLAPRPAWVLGVGERLEPVGPLPPLALLLATPGPPLSTAEVYRVYDSLGGALTLGSPNRRMPALPGLREGHRGAQGEALRHLAGNDLEPAASRLRPAIVRVRKQIAAAGAVAVGMSGSGPTVFGIFDNPGAARGARAGIRWDPEVRVNLATSVPEP